MFSNRKHQRLASLYISRHALHLAIATRQLDGSFTVRLDTCHWSDPDVTTSAGIDWAGFIEQMTLLVGKWDLAGIPTSLSLDGDLCVARIVTGSADRVDRELVQLATRVPRYLSLGAGAKVTGSARQTIGPAMDYAVTAVANRGVVQRLCSELGKLQLRLLWAEPALVSAARLVGQLEIDRDGPVMLADGGGKQWDLGICHRGRLMLDYRPAAAFSAIAFAEILIDHMPRLMRFCRQHRKLVGDDPSDLMIYGPEQSAAFACDALSNQTNLQVAVLKTPKNLGNWSLEVGEETTEPVPVIGSLIPLLDEASTWIVPDMLSSIELKAETSRAWRFFRVYWPAIAASFVLLFGWSSLSYEQLRSRSVIAERVALTEELSQTQLDLASVTNKRELLANLKTLQTKLPETDWNGLIGRITQCLPEQSRLATIRYEGADELYLKGIVSHEPLVFELVGWLRQLPDVVEVALDGTAPSATQGTDCDIRLRLKQTAIEVSSDDSE